MTVYNYFRRHPIKIITMLLFGLVFGLIGISISYLENKTFYGAFIGLFAMVYYAIRRSHYED